MQRKMVTAKRADVRIKPATSGKSADDNSQMMKCLGRDMPALAWQKGTVMLIIDSQVHVWPPHRPDRPLGEAGLDRTPFSYHELVAAMDLAGVDRAILVPPSFDRDRNDYVI